MDPENTTPPESAPIDMTLLKLAVDLDWHAALIEAQEDQRRARALLSAPLPGPMSMIDLPTTEIAGGAPQATSPEPASTPTPAAMKPAKRRTAKQPTNPTDTSLPSRLHPAWRSYLSSIHDTEGDYDHRPHNAIPYAPAVPTAITEPQKGAARETLRQLLRVHPCRYTSMLWAQIDDCSCTARAIRAQGYVDVAEGVVAARWLMFHAPSIVLGALAIWRSGDETICTGGGFYRSTDRIIVHLLDPGNVDRWRIINTGMFLERPGDAELLANWLLDNPAASHMDLLSLSTAAEAAGVARPVPSVPTATSISTR